MKKIFKFIIVLLVLVGIGVGVYFIFFANHKKEDLYAKVEIFYNLDENSSVNIVEGSIKEMQVVLSVNDTENVGENAKICLEEYIGNNTYYNKIIEYTHNNVLFATEVENYRRSLNKSYNRLTSKYDDCNEYLKNYYLKINNRTSSEINSSEKGALVSYINNFVTLLKELEECKIEFCKYLSLSQSKAYLDTLNQTPINSLYLKLTGNIIDYINKSEVEYNGKTVKVNINRVKNVIEKIDTDKSIYINETKKYDNLYTLMTKVNSEKLIVAYVLDQENEYYEQLNQSNKTEELNNSVEFISNIA